MTIVSMIHPEMLKEIAAFKEEAKQRQSLRACIIDEMNQEYPEFGDIEISDDELDELIESALAEVRKMMQALKAIISDVIADCPNRISADDLMKGGF